MSTQTIEQTWPAQCERLTDSDRSLIEQIKRSLPLLADVSRGDVLLYAATDQPNVAVVVGEARPNTVPSVHGDEPLLGQRVLSDAEPTVLRVIRRGIVRRGNHRLVKRDGTTDHPTIQDVYPVRSDGQIIGALSVELGLLESLRQKRKSPVFRRMVERMRRAVATGILFGAENLGPLGEHDGALVVNERGQILYISSLAEQIYRKAGHTHSLEHANLLKLGSDETAFLTAVKTGRCVEHVVEENGLWWMKKAIPVRLSQHDGLLGRVLPGRDEQDMVAIIVHDMTEELQKERELKIKSAMIQEIHHRVKNNLQTIAALLRLQARRTGSPEVAGILQETINRILSISVVHEFLARDESSLVDLHEVLQRIIVEVSRSILDPDKRIRLTLEGDHIFLPTQQATSCALVLNELLQNAVEHGFATQNEGFVIVRLNLTDDDVRMEVVDDGQGLDSDFNLNHRGSLGLQIVRTLVSEDLKGRFEIRADDDHGTRATVRFSRAHYRAWQTDATLNLAQDKGKGN